MSSHFFFKGQTVSFLFVVSLALFQGIRERWNARRGNPEGSSPKQAVEINCHGYSDKISFDSPLEEDPIKK